MPQRIDVPGHGIVEFPDGMSDDQIVSAIKANTAVKYPVPVSGDGKPWGDVAKGAAANTIPSLGRAFGGIYDAVRHPINTAGNLLDVAAGGLQNVLPDSLVKAVNQIDPNAASAAQAREKASAVGRFYKDRYGSMEGVKGAISTDPAGVLMDSASVLTGGGGLASKIPALNKVGGALSTAGKAIDPVLGTMKLASGAIPMAGGLAADLVGNLGTHSGGESLRQATRAGIEGGNTARTFTGNMRGNIPMTDVLGTVKQNIQQMGQDKAAAYRSGMAAMSKDKSVLDFSGIDKAVSDAAGMSAFKGQVKNAKAAQVTQDIADAVAEWKALNPAEYHTPEGLDALKQRVGGIVEGIPFEERTARSAGSRIYNSIKDEITKQAPTYANTMKGYSEASDQIKEIERALSAGHNASADAGMRKLQSLMRNNANTNYGNRLDLAKQLEQQGGREILPALAGQALNTWTPRGLGNVVAGGLGMGGYALGGPGLAIPTLASQSPRLMGETALKVGQAASPIIGSVNYAKKGLLDSGIDPNILTQLLYQSNQTGKVQQ